ncbi:hypothetical protein QPX44_04230 [Corynebacterium pseudodiphtheriticum]|uniref:hypothetical protein n=1 Tax=Corynebacterium TaxID=1716 RepID=UPI00223B9DF8|nr:MULTISPECIES: hypothetical protein [Corynebacterium]MCT1818177.1 hypothetical protein [Corynebacterium propinquum]MDK4238453.1 hypothetical protein [Corynebacterium propinquum]MDK4315378.1 hypothetical protein [Corynebacterium pseudodiphtheriticum]MDK8665479.1 hypothetical protein [Corynebacterium propinquum]WKS35064.1 hypothetical protein NLL50_04865 [Corynebacterium propinquum]
MTKAIALAVIGTLLPLASATTTPPTNEANAPVFYNITDWLSCSKKPQLPWCN